jgi:hypothetical protein
LTARGRAIGVSVPHHGDQPLFGITADTERQCVEELRATTLHQRRIVVRERA